MEVLCFLPSKHSPLCVFDLRATHARILLPAALASVSFGFCISSSSSSSGPPLKYVSLTQKKNCKLCLFSWRHREKSMISLICSSFGFVVCHHKQRVNEISKILMLQPPTTTQQPPLIVSFLFLSLRRWNKKVVIGWALLVPGVQLIDKDKQLLQYIT